MGRITTKIVGAEVGESACLGDLHKFTVRVEPCEGGRWIAFLGEKPYIDNYLARKCVPGATLEVENSPGGAPDRVWVDGSLILR